MVRSELRLGTYFEIYSPSIGICNYDVITYAMTCVSMYVIRYAIPAFPKKTLFFIKISEKKMTKENNNKVSEKNKTKNIRSWKTTTKRT